MGCVRSLALLAGVALPGLAMAQEAATTPAQGQGAQGTGEIIVTAQRRSESLSKIPVAVSALSSADMGKLGITNAASLSGQVPALQVNSPFGDSQPNFTLRGIGVSNEHNPNQASPIGIYVDDAYIAARPAQGLDMFDLERVEVLHGPQGTLYGRNTTGGAINFITKKPSLEGDSGYLEAGYGNYNNVSANGAFEATLVPDKVGLRVSFNYDNADGYIKNIALGQPNANSTDLVAARAILRIKPDDRLDIMLKVSIARSDPTQASVYDQGTGADGYNPVLQTSRALKGMSFFETDSQRLGNSYLYTNGTELTVKYHLTDAIDLMSLTSYNFANQAFSQEGSGLESKVFTQPLDTLYGNRFKMFNQELRASYAKGGTNVQAGLYYGYDDVKSDSYYWLLDGAAMVHQLYDQTRKSYAAFVQGDQKLDDHLGVTVGLRYTWDRSNYGDYASYLTPSSYYTGTRDTSIFPYSQGTYIFGSYNALTGGYNSGPSIPLDSKALTGRAAINYTFDNGPMIYASYGRGYRSAAYCGQCFLGPAITTTLPESVDAYEIGAKGHYFDHRLSLALAAFLMNYRNQQIDEIQGADTILENLPKSQIKGVEFDAGVTLSRDFRVGVNGSWLDARYKSGQLLYGNVTGNQMAYTPDWQVSGHFDWTAARIGKGAVNVSPSFVYTSNVFFTPYENGNGEGFMHQTGNAKVNATLSWDTDAYSIRLWVKNLFNAKTFVDGLDLTASFGYDYMVQAPPRQFGIAFNHKF
jgi:iron complex outermembrane recepter protein